MRIFSNHCAKAICGIALIAHQTASLDVHDRAEARVSGGGRQETLPGGTPLRLCPQSRHTDLYNIASVEITKQPLYIEDDFLFHLYGSFRDGIGPNATINATVDCGTHCDDYDVKPGDPIGESIVVDFAEFVRSQQPLSGRKRNGTCSPEPGFALITAGGYAWEWVFGWPGYYNVTFDAKTATDDRIFCVTAEVCLKWEDPSRNEEYKQGPWNNCSWPY